MVCPVAEPGSRPECDSLVWDWRSLLDRQDKFDGRRQGEQGRVLLEVSAAWKAEPFIRGVTQPLQTSSIERYFLFGDCKRCISIARQLISLLPS